MSYIATNPPGKVNVLVDFFWPLNSTIETGVAWFSRARSGLSPRLLEAIDKATPGK